MKRKTTVRLVLITITTLAIAAGAHAQRGDTERGERGDKHGDERMISFATERLELDTNQVDALRSLQAEMQETRDMMRGEGDSLKDSLSMLIADDSFDQGQALSLINERIASLQANAPELVAAAGQFLDGLDASQREQVREFVEHAGARHGRRGHHD